MKLRCSPINSIFLCFSFFLLTACSNLGYFWSVSRGQMKLLKGKVSIEEALEKYDFTEEQKTKLKLVSEIKSFSKQKLQMDIDEDIYSSYVQLDRPYVTYLLRVSLAYELKAYEWSFPFTGSVPYKGFFDKKKATKEAKTFPKENYDVYIRGVTAYSTLGWFEDSILSSMLSYEERDFVVMIFHELAHTVLFFKDNVNFNERFAEFVGRKATLSFYLEKEGEKSENLQRMLFDWEDQITFSSFMTQEYNNLNEWYKTNKGKVTPETKQKRIRKIQVRFLTEIHPKLKTENYNYFSNIELNNAKLLSYRSYNFNMEEFEKLFNSSKINKNIKAFIDYCFRFKDEENPEVALTQTVNKL
ncbi:MAG: aminopeptidase [Oligoflexia bacterium]|nr:aminopeptidase [Oligoflexia bacterium]